METSATDAARLPAGDVAASSRFTILASVIILILIAGAGFRGSRGFEASVAMAMVIAFASSGWWLSARSAESHPSTPARLTVAATLSLGIATLLPNVLGHFGWLSAPLFLPAVAAVFLAALLARPRERTAERSELTRASRSIGALLLAFVGVLVVLFALKQTYHVRLAPLGFFGIDDNSYHASAVAVWNRFHDLRMVKYSYGDSSTPFYPIGSELEAWTLLAPFRDSDFMMRWSQLPFFLASLAAVGSVALRLGASRQSATLAVLLYASMPRLFPALALTTGNDCATAFYAVATVDAALALRRSLRSAAYAGIALGLLAGTKYVGFLFAIPLAAVIALAVTTVNSDGRRSRAALTVTVVVAAVLCGGYSYARNLAVTGNPLFPVPLSIGGHTILHGWPDYAAGSMTADPEGKLRFGSLAQHITEIGRVLAITIPLALAAPILSLFASGRRSVRTAALLMAPLFILEFALLMRDHRDLRYVIAALGLGAAGCAWTIDRAGRAATAIRLAITAALAIEIVLTAANHWPVRVAVILFGATAAGGVVVSLPLLRKRRTELILASAALMLLLPLTLGSAIERYQREKLSQLSAQLPESPAAAALERLTSGRPAIIAYNGMNRPYPFFGAALQNDVVLVPSSGDLGERFYDWGGDASLPFEGGTYSVWKQNLDRTGAEFAVVVRGDGELPERAWLQQDRGALIWATPAAEIWSLRGYAPLTNGGNPSGTPR